LVKNFNLPFLAAIYFFYRVKFLKLFEIGNNDNKTNFGLEKGQSTKLIINRKPRKKIQTERTIANEKKRTQKIGHGMDAVTEKDQTLNIYCKLTYDLQLFQ